MSDKPEPRRPKSWNSNVVQNGYGLLLVSQFTLYGRLKGNKPDFSHAMNGKDASELFD